MYYKKVYKKWYETDEIAKQQYAEIENNEEVVKSSDKHGEFLLVPTELVDEFVVTTLSRDDFENVNANGKNLSNEEMREVANAIEDGILDSGAFWDALREQAEKMGLTNEEED